MSYVDTVIVGAGPYGLSLAAHLREAGVPFQILGTALESWRSFMPKGMLLRSEPFASNLWDAKRQFTLERYSAKQQIPYRPVHNPVRLSRFLEYADWFRQNAVGDVRDVRVRRLWRNSHNFHFELSDGDSLEARNAILATGYMAFRHVPPEIARLPENLWKHSTSLVEVNAYAGKNCTILGCGQSALESAALLHEAGAKVRIIARRDRISWNTEPNVNRGVMDALRKPEAGTCAGWECLAISELPRLFRRLLPADRRHRYVATTYGPAGAWWLRERVAGKIDLLFRHTLKSAEPAGSRVRLVLDGPQGALKEILTDQVIAATGFKTDIDRLSYLDLELKAKIAREGYAPALSGSFETSVPRLFAVGALSAPTFGPVMRFMFGAKHAAPILARHLKKHLKNGTATN